MVLELKLKANTFTQTFLVNVNDHGGVINIKFMSNYFPVEFNTGSMTAWARIPLKKAVSPLDKVLGVHTNQCFSEWIEPAEIIDNTVTFDFTKLLRGGYI